MKQFSNRKDVHPIELNLTPMIDLFVSLIAFLLLCAAFIRYGGVHVEVPQAATREDVKTNQDSKKLSLTFEIIGNDVVITGYNGDFTNPIPSVKANFSVTEMEKMKEYLRSLHQKYPVMGISIFHAAPETRYEVGMHVLDAMKASTVVDQVVFGAGVVE